MPYISKAARERAKWMSLPEAVAHVRRADKCTEAEARSQVLQALIDGAIRSKRWQWEEGDVAPPTGLKMIVPSDDPPTRSSWAEAVIDWPSGRVLDEFGEYNHGKCRLLLLSSVEVRQIWPELEPQKRAANGERPITKEDSERLYLARLNHARQQSGAPPRREDDVEWAASVGLSRDRVFKLRQQHLTDAEKKGGRPLKPIGQNSAKNKQTV